MLAKTGIQHAGNNNKKGFDTKKGADSGSFFVREQGSLLQLFAGADGLGGVFVENEGLGLALDDGFVNHHLGNVFQ